MCYCAFFLFQFWNYSSLLLKVITECQTPQYNDLLK